MAEVPVTNGNGVTTSHELYLTKEMSRGEGLGRSRTDASLSISPEVLERLCNSPQALAKAGPPRKPANPMGIALVGFVMCLGPLSCDLMGWRGAGGSGASSIPGFFFFGGVLMLLGGLLEFFAGNTFPALVFTTFGAFWPTFGATLLPQFHAYAAYAPADATSASAGLETQGFNAGFGFFTLSMTMIVFLFLVVSVRTNIAFFIVFLALDTCLGLVTGAYWQLAADYAGNAAFATKLLVAAGAFGFITTAVGWWLLFAMLLSAVDFPFALPLGDLSGYVRSASERKAESSQV